MKKIFIIILLLSVFVRNYAQKPRELYIDAVTKINTGKTDSAILLLDAAIVRESNNYLFYLRKGEIEFNNANYATALKNFESVNSLKSDYADLWLAKCHTQMNNDSMAIEFLKKHLLSEYRIADKKIKSDVAFNPLKNTEEWFSLWQEDWYTEEELLEDDVNFLVKKGEYLEAITLIDSKLTGSKNPEPLYRYKAQIGSLMGNYKSSAMDWTESLKIKRDNLFALKERGKAYLNSGKYKESAEDFTRALRIEPADFQLYILRAQAYRGQKEFVTAIKDVNFLLGYFPEDENALFLCGELNYENGNYVEALRYFNKNLRIDSGNSEYYKARGKAYYQTRMYRYAVDDLSMSLDLKPDDGEAYYFKGMSRYYSGDKTGACADWKIAARLGESKAVEQLINNCQ